MGVIPKYDFVLGKEIKTDTGVVTGGDIEDTHQHYEVLAVGPGRYEDGFLIEPTVKPGEIVYILKHATADTPRELTEKGLALFQASRVMGVVE